MSQNVPVYPDKETSSGALFLWENLRFMWGLSSTLPSVCVGVAGRPRRIVAKAVMSEGPAVYTGAPACWADFMSPSWTDEDEERTSEAVAGMNRP